MTIKELPSAFLVADIFQPGQVRGRFTDLDRVVLGGVVPTGTPLELPNHKESGRTSFLDRRELGALNIGGPGVVRVDAKAFAVQSLGCVYAGAGTQKVVFESKDAKNPARYFFLSCPANSRAAVSCA